MKLNFQLFDLTTDKLVEQKEYSIDFQKDIFHYRILAYINKVPNEDNNIITIQENVLESFRGVYRRDALCGVDMANSRDKNGVTIYYEVSLSIYGVLNDVIIRFEKLKDATIFYNQALDYMSGKINLD